MGIFMDLPAIAVNNNGISARAEAGKWIAIPYETRLGKGRLLATPESLMAEDVAFNINLDGWHRIYVCMVDLGRDTYTHLKLTSDLTFSGMRTPKIGNPTTWIPQEYMQEFYWKSADLTGQQIILRKPKGRPEAISNLVWIRCEKMEDAEIEAYNAEPCRCIQTHIDTDPYAEEFFETLDETLMKLEALKNSNAEFCSIETSWYGEHVETENYIPMKTYFGSKWRGYDFDTETLLKRHIEYAHQVGIKAYSATRMSVGNFTDSVTTESFNKNFVIDNPQLHCKNRDDTTVNVCSYAYPETQEYMLAHIKDMVSYGFDGVSLIYIRGMHIGFEQPVLERFAELYPGINPKVLPFADERLHGVWCEFMTEFMRKLRKMLGKDIKISVLTDYGLATSKHLGLDVETWAKEGLIDHATQCDMEIYEDLSGCLKEDGTIDLDKYKQINERTEIVKRSFATNIDKTCAHIGEYLNLKQYGVDVYGILPWVHTRSLEEYNRHIQRLKEAGVEKFHAWNTNHMVWDLPEYNTMRSINNDGVKVDDLFPYYRTLSICDSDIRNFSPNWKG